MRDAAPSEGAWAEGVERPESAADMIVEVGRAVGRHECCSGAFVLVVWVCSWLRKVLWVEGVKEGEGVNG